MAENVSISEGAGKIIATDEVTINATPVQVQRMKLIHGDDNEYDGDVHEGSGLPVQDALAVSKLALVTVAYGTLTGSFANLSIGTLTGMKRYWVWNDTDAAVVLSEDAGSTAHHIIPARASRALKFIDGTTALYGKYASAPSTGNLYIESEG